MGRVTATRPGGKIPLMKRCPAKESSAAADAEVAGEKAATPGLQPYLGVTELGPSEFFAMEHFFGPYAADVGPYGPEYYYDMFEDAHGACYGLPMDPVVPDFDFCDAVVEEDGTVGTGMAFSALVQALTKIEHAEYTADASPMDCESMCTALLEALTEEPSQPRKKGQLDAGCASGACAETPRWTATEEQQDPAALSWTSEPKRERKGRAAAATAPQKEAPSTPPTAASSVSSGAARSEQTRGGPALSTAMLRNIPNKYTREMLVRQLDANFRGEYDFLYLPIDFKNKCNVGYAFVNFRTLAAYDRFTETFDGVAVSTCLPGLNSHKIAEVTPARVHGFEENVSRLRGKGVMLELAAEHPEWMPLIFDEGGVAQPFPAAHAASPTDAVRESTKSVITSVSARRPSQRASGTSRRQHR